MNMISIVLELNEEHKAYQIWLLIFFEFFEFFLKMSDLLQLQV
jgi:hypothetical protein